MWALSSVGAASKLILALLSAGIMVSTGLRDQGLLEVEETSFQHARRFGTAHEAKDGMASGVQDVAHSSIHEYLRRAYVMEETADKGTLSPQNLTVKANGLELDWNKDSRAGHVNPKRLRLSVRWVGLDPDTASKLTVRLTDVNHNMLCSAIFIDGDQSPSDQNYELEELEDGIAVACHELPENVQLLVRVQVQRKRTDTFRTKSWTLETGDVSSGDAQGRIMFLPTDYSAQLMQQQYGDRVSHEVVQRGNLEERLTAKEVTIFDADERSSDQPPMDIFRNGFEFDTSGDLREAVQAFQQQLHGSLDKDLGKDMYALTQVQRHIKTCALLKQRDVEVWMRAAKRHAEGELERASVPCPLQFFAGNLEVLTRDSKILGFWQDCKQKSESDATDLECNEAIDLNNIPAIDKDARLPYPARVEFTTRPFRVEQAVSRLRLGLTGVSMAVASQETREQIMRQFLTEPIRIDKFLVQIENETEAKAAVAVVEASAESAQKLVEAMEHRASLWWRNKTGMDTKSACFSMNYRHTRGGMEGLPAAHIDAVHVAEWFKPGGAFPASSQSRVRNLLGMDIKDALKHVAVTFNEWINAGPETIVELPLTIMDTTTLDSKDAELAWIQGGLDSKMVRWSEAHRWYYRNLQPGEGYMFITSPHEGPNHTFSGTPHSAFHFIGEGDGTAARPRQSFEFRCLVVDETWTSPTTLFDADDVPGGPKQDQIVQSGAKSLMAAMIMDNKAFMESLRDKD